METTKHLDMKAKEMKLRGSPQALKYPAWVDLKYDGEYTWAVKDVMGKVYLINKYGLERTDCEATHKLESLDAHTFVMIGELYCDDGKAGKLYELLGRKKDNGLNFTPFDIVELDGNNMAPLPLIDRVETLASLVGLGRSVGVLAEDWADAELVINGWIAEGYEGGVVKELNNPLMFGPCNWAKVKMKDESEYEVILIDNVKERIEVDVNGVTVGVKCCNADKSKLRCGMKVNIEHQGVLKSGSLRHPVYKGFVPQGGS